MGQLITQRPHLLLRQTVRTEVKLRPLFHLDKLDEQPARDGVNRLHHLQFTNAFHGTVLVQIFHQILNLLRGEEGQLLQVFLRATVKVYLVLEKVLQQFVLLFRQFVIDILDVNPVFISAFPGIDTSPHTLLLVDGTESRQGKKDNRTDK